MILLSLLDLLISLMLVASGAGWGVPFDMLLFVAVIFIGKGLVFMWPFDWFSLFDVFVGVMLIISFILPPIFLYILAGLMFLKVLNSIITT